VKAKISILIAVSFALLGGCAAHEDTTARRATHENTAPRRGVLTQISTYDALSAGLYDGVAPVKDLDGCGDFGLGTLDRWNGEVVLLDGKYHLIRGDGSVQPVTDLNVTTPFLAVTWFDEDSRKSLADGTTFDQLKQKPEEYLPSLNLVYAIKLEGLFHHVKTRSIFPQTKPYKVMSELVKTQPTFEFKDIAGTMVGFWTPPSMKGIGLAGWHLHFLTKDGKGGGHVLEFTSQDAVMKLNEKLEVDWRLSGLSDYRNAVLGTKP
jgi:acetolactate decarboxylase